MEFESNEGMAKIESATIFLGGVHGVGKTTIGRRVAATHGLRFFSAGELLSQSSASNATFHKAVDDIEGNQDRLVAAVRAATVGVKGYILDGHFCLIGSDGLPAPIPKATFQELNLLGGLVLIDEPGAIANRVKARDGRALSELQIAELQEAEVAHGMAICTQLGLPFTTCYPSESAKMETWLNTLLTSL